MTITIPQASAVTRVPLTDALAMGPDVWDGLLARSGAASPFMTWAWYRACADAMAAELVNSYQAIILRSAAGDLEAVVPVRQHQDRYWGPPVSGLEWSFGDFGCPDHRDLLAAPAADLDALTGVLDELPWVVLRLGNAAEPAGNIERFLPACERRGWRVERRPLGRYLYLDLPDAWETYLASLSGHARRAIRRNERKLYRDHDLVVTEYGQERVEEGLRHLHRLHALRWRGTGAFGDPAMQRLHGRFAAAQAERGQLWLVTLDLDGTPAAAWYGFSLGDTVYHYQSGRDPRWERDRVGSILVGLMIRRAIERGCRRFDFLRGEEPYKATWTRTARSCYDITIFRPGWRGTVVRALDWIERPLRGKGLRDWLAAIPLLRHQREETVGEEGVDG